MKTRMLKALPIAMVALFSLTSCNVLDNLISTILVNAASNLPILVNGVDVLPGLEDAENFEDINASPEIMEWDNSPTTEANRATLYYLKNILVLPKSLSTTVLGKTISVDFNVTMEGVDNAIDNFKVMTVSSDELPEGFSLDLSSLPFPVSFALDVYIPIGESDLLDDINSFEDLTGIVDSKPKGDILDATEQADRDITLKMEIKSGSKSKNKSFYFGLKSPGVGRLILDTIFGSGYLINKYSVQNNELDSLENLPTDENDPDELQFFRHALAIPKHLEIADIGPVDFEVTTTSENLFFITTEEKPISEIDPGNTLITGNIQVYVIIPVGTYKDQIPGNVNTIDELSSHIKGLDARDLYPYANQPEASFEITITATKGTQSMSDTYYFHITEPMIDEEILDFVLDYEFMINKVHYKDVHNPYQPPELPTSEETEMDISYLTETLVIPESVEISDLGNKRISFDYEFANEGADEDLFYQASLSETIQGYPVVAHTFTPLGEDFDPTTENGDIEEFADEIQTLSTENLFAFINQDDRQTSITITANVHNSSDEITSSRSRTFYFRLIKANIDEEIVDFIVDSDNLLNVINYSDIEEGNDDAAVKSIAKNAKNQEDPYEIEYLVETLIIPETIVLDRFDGKQIQIESTINGAPNLFTASKDVTVNADSITAKTVTPLGTFDASGVPAGDLNALADELNNSNTKELYADSQASDKEFSIDIRITILENGVPTDKTRTTTFYLKAVKADLDDEIGDYIMDHHPIVNYIDHQTPGANMDNPVQPTDESNPLEVTNFKETIFIPKSFGSFEGFGYKEIEFDYDLFGDDELFIIGEKSHVYEGQTVTGTTFTPIGTHFDGSEITSMANLITFMKNTSNLIVINDANALDTDQEVTMRVTLSIDGKEVSFKDYYFVLIPF